MVKEMQLNTKDAVQAMDKITEISNKQLTSILKNNEKYTTISNEINDVRAAVVTSLEAIKTMETMKDQIMEMIGNLTSIAHENSASTEQASASMEQQNASIEHIAESSKSLSVLSLDLKDIIDKFKI